MFGRESDSRDGACVFFGLSSFKWVFVCKSRTGDWFVLYACGRHFEINQTNGLLYKVFVDNVTNVGNVNYNAGRWVDTFFVDLYAIQTQ